MRFKLLLILTIIVYVFADLSADYINNNRIEKLEQSKIDNELIINKQASDLKAHEKKMMEFHEAMLEYDEELERVSKVVFEGVAEEE
jgi:hypothetical protein